MKYWQFVNWEPAPIESALKSRVAVAIAAYESGDKNAIKEYYRQSATIETTETRPGDIIRVYKNDMGYCGYNPRTNRHFYIFVSMLRNAEIFKLQEVLQ